MSIRLRFLGLLGLLPAAFLSPGCAPTAPLAAAGITPRLPANWREVDRASWPVPGQALAAWSGPGGASLVVYRTLPAPGGRAETALTEVVTRYENLPGLKVVARQVEKVSGVDAARIEAVAPGTGDAFAPTGTGVAVAPRGKTLVPTLRVLLVVPRGADTLSLVWHAPESSADALRSSVRETLASLTVDPRRLGGSSY